MYVERLSLTHLSSCIQILSQFRVPKTGNKLAAQYTNPNLETFHEPQTSILVLDAVRQIHARVVIFLAVHQLGMENRVLGLGVSLPLEMDVVRGFREVFDAPCEFT